MSRRKLDAEISEKILDEVMRETAQGGTGKVLTLKIASKLGISEPTIFLRYKSKQILMDEAFALAWKRFNHVPGYSLVRAKAKTVSFEDFRPVFMDKLTHKKEVIYLHHYLASVYYHHDFVQKVREEYFAHLDETVASLYGPLPLEQVHMIEECFLKAEIDNLSYFADHLYEANEENLKLLFSALKGFFWAPLEDLARSSALK
jgi:AcrR family transcriptional regulator